MKTAVLCSIFNCLSLHIAFACGIIYARSLIGHIEHNKRKTQRGGESMTEAAAQARKEYWKAWRKANADKVKQYNKNYWEKKAAQAAAAAEGAANENQNCVHGK